METIDDHLHVGDLQPLDSDLTEISGQGLSADKILYTQGVHDWTTTPLFACGRAFLSNNTVSSMRVSLGLGDLSLQNLTGWMLEDDTLTYASPTTVTSANPSWYNKGDKISCQNNGQKWWYVLGISGSVLTVTGGTNYPVENAAITTVKRSHFLNPIGFPHYFEWSGASGFNPQGFSGTPTEAHRFSILGRMLVFGVYISGTSNAITFTGTMPIDPYQGNHWCINVQDSGAYSWGHAQVIGASTVITFYKDAGTTGWTASGTKAAKGYIMYYF